MDHFQRNKPGLRLAMLLNKKILFGCIFFASYANFCKGTRYTTPLAQRRFKSMVLARDQLPVKNWYPAKLFQVDPASKYAIIILNTPIHFNSTVMTSLWKRAAIRCTVDRGTDRWITYLDENNLNYDEYKPDIITGDFDSASKSNLSMFRDLGVTVSHTPNQSQPDFRKAIHEIMDRFQPEKLDYVIAVAENSGRLDHIMANLNTMFFFDMPIFLLGQKSITWLLREKRLHSIYVTSDFTKGKKIVGLIPLGSPSTRLWTNGLKWDLDDSTLRFGDLISSSNTYASENTNQVLVEVPESSLIWTMSLPSF